MCISKYLYSIVALCLFALPVWAQEPVALSDSTAVKAVSNEVKTPIYQGAYVSVDIFNPVATIFNGGKFEVSVMADVSLWQRLFPAVELGVMAINEQKPNYVYSSSGGFVKLGANYNFLNYTIDRKYDHLLYAGARYGYSFMGYQVNNAAISGDYWNETGNYSGEHLTSHFGWLEIVVGVRVQIYKQFFMGLALQVKTFGHYYNNSAQTPTYIPGFGVHNGETIFGCLYHLTYQIQYKK